MPGGLSMDLLIRTVPDPRACLPLGFYDTHAYSAGLGAPDLEMSPTPACHTWSQCPFCF